MAVGSWQDAGTLNERSKDAPKIERSKDYCIRVLHAGLVKMSILDQDVSNEARESVERILDKIEDIIPELREQEMEFDFDMEFGQQEEMEIGG